MARETRLKHAIAKVRDQYDYILIDSPPSLGLLTVNALTASDSVLIPLQCEYLALEGLTQLIGAIRLVQDHLNPGLRIEGVLLTMYDSRLNLSQQVAEEARKFFAERLYRTVIPEKRSAKRGAVLREAHRPLRSTQHRRRQLPRAGAGGLGACLGRYWVVGSKR